MTVRWPGRVPAGKTSSFVWGMHDVFPTLCEIAGLKAPKGLDGMSVLPTLLGKPQTPHPHLYWEFPKGSQQAVRMGNWKGLRFGTKSPIQLFDLAHDVGESNDVASANPSVVKQIAAIMSDSHVPSPFWPLKEKAGGRKSNAKKSKKSNKPPK